MDPEEFSIDTSLEKSETTESSSSSSSLETNRSLTGCDTKLIDRNDDTNRNSDDSNLLTKESSDDPLVEDAKKKKNLHDESPSVSEPGKSRANEKPSPVTVIEKCAREAWLDKIGIRGNIAPKFPHYSELKDRLQSYSSWTSQNQQPQVLSEAGFFFIGVQDRTACFHCGGGLREWKRTDDPWIEHAHWFPKCNFVLNIKGQKFIDLAWRNKLIIPSTKEMQNAADVIDNVLDVVIGSKLKNNLQTDNISSPKYADPKIVTSDKESFRSCQICFEEERNVVYLPCNHYVSCRKCASEIRHCVVCRATIDELVRCIAA